MAHITAILTTAMSMHIPNTIHTHSTANVHIHTPAVSHICPVWSSVWSSVGGFTVSPTPPHFHILYTTTTTTITVVTITTNTTSATDGVTASGAVLGFVVLGFILRFRFGL